MQVRYMLLCQHASDAGGIVNLLNAGISNIKVMGFPTIIPITIWIQAVIELSDVGRLHRHTLSVRSEDGQIVQMPQPDGKKVPTLFEMNSNVQKAPHASAEVKGIPLTNLIAQVNVYLERAGTYQFRCDLDGKPYECHLYVEGPGLPVGEKS